MKGPSCAACAAWRMKQVRWITAACLNAACLLHAGIDTGTLDVRGSGCCWMVWRSETKRRFVLPRRHCRKAGGQVDGLGPERPRPPLLVAPRHV